MTHMFISGSRPSVRPTTSPPNRLRRGLTTGIGASSSTPLDACGYALSRQRIQQMNSCPSTPATKDLHMRAHGALCASDYPTLHCAFHTSPSLSTSPHFCSALSARTLTTLLAQSCERVVGGLLHFALMSARQNISDVT